MPLFDFRCETCKNDFEAFARAGATPPCPQCRSQQVTRRLSGFSVGVSKSEKAGSCASGSA